LEIPKINIPQIQIKEIYIPKIQKNAEIISKHVGKKCSNYKDGGFEYKNIWQWGPEIVFH